MQQIIRFFRRPLFTTAVVAGALSLMAIGGARYWEISKNMEIFASAYRAINAEYVEQVDPSTLMRTAIDSMLAELDPYTNYFSEAQMEQLRIEVVGGWDGVGIETEVWKNEVIVREVIEDTPASVAGVRIGDRILQVDGKDTKGRKAEEVDKILNGKAGTKVEIKFMRPATKEERTLTMERGKISRKNVPYYGMLPDGETGYIILTTFTDRAGGNIGDAIRDLQEKHKPTRFILDLRNNGGGLLIEAVNICNLFVEKGKEIVSTRNKVVEWDRSFKTLNNPLNTNVPVIVLINERSASASEIVAGALQDLDRAVLVGRKSFGKGLVQNTKDIGYNSKIKLTTAKYYIPSGRCIQALEYKDGTPIEIPDSLRKAFKTAGGRTVYDGGGLLPDVKVEAQEPAAVVKALQRAHFIADFANAYRQRHDSIAPAADFRLTEADFAQFVEQVRASGYAFDYHTNEVANRIDSLNDAPAEMRAANARLRARLQEQKAADIAAAKKDIIRLLETEIVARYYYERGRVQLQLREDTDVQEATRLFNDKERFAKLLKVN